MHPLRPRCVLLVALAAALVWLAVPARAADAPVAGTWKLSVVSGLNEFHLAILKIEDKDGKPTATLVATAPPYKDAKLEKVTGDAKTVRYSFALPQQAFVVAFHAPKGEEKPKTLYGTLKIGPQNFLATLNRTEDKEIDEKSAGGPLEGSQDLVKATRATGEEKEKALQEIAEKNGSKPLAYIAASQLLTALIADKDATEAKLKSASEQLLKIAAAYGPEQLASTTANAARALLKAEKGAGLALELARKAEKDLGKDAPAATVANVLKVLAAALKKNGKADDAKPVEERLAKLEHQLDEEFEKTAIPFKPEKFGGRKGKSQRVVVCELFTGAQCPPCVSADIAFDAALKTYKYNEVVFLQYHLHIPGPDALTNEETIARQKYYGNAIRGTPTMFADGKATPPMGGSKQMAKERYESLCKLLNEELEKDAEAGLKLNVTRDGDKVTIKADVSDLKKTGDKVRLRLALIEDVVRYPGSNGQRLHEHVVRAFPGGVEGMKLEKETDSQNATVNLADLRKTLNTYIDEFKDRAGQASLKEGDHPLDLKNLKVVAFVQDDESKEILQAVQAGVPEGK